MGVRLGVVAALVALVVASTTGASAIQPKAQGGKFGLNKPIVAMARVVSDVDLYDWPGGVGKVIAILRKNQVVPVSHCRQDNWCHLPRVGWVWGDFIRPLH